MAPLFDLKLADQRRRRALGIAGPSAAFLLDAAIGEFTERLSVVQRSFAIGVDIQTPLPTLAEAIAKTGKVDHVLRLDRLVDTRGEMPFAIADAEAIPLASASVDLVVSALALHLANDLPGAFAQIRRALRPDGLFLCVLPGGDTLTELRQSLTAAEAELFGGAAPRVAPFAGVRQIGGLLQRAGFALPVADRDRISIRYSDLGALIRDLRSMGATNVLRESRRPLTRSVVARASEVYADRFSDPDGRIRATVELVWLSGWAPHESQQKPLSPGSAKKRLADALGVLEESAGEKPGFSDP